MVDKRAELVAEAEPNRLLVIVLGLCCVDSGPVSVWPIVLQAARVVGVPNTATFVVGAARPSVSVAER